jgi:hypothetical protein
MIFKTRNTFPVYVVSIRPGKVADPYLGDSSVAFDHCPEMKEVLKALAEQNAAYNKSIRRMGSEQFYGKKGMERKRQFGDFVVETLKRIGIPEIAEGASSVNKYGEGPFKKKDRPVACVSVTRMWVKRKSYGKFEELS